MRIIGIKITEENREKINAKISECEGRASARTCKYEDVLALKMRAEKKTHIIPKKYMRGCVAVYYKLVSCNSYGSYRAESTHVTIIHTGKDWIFSGATCKGHGTHNGNSVYNYILGLSETAMDKYLEIVRYSMCEC